MIFPIEVRVYVYFFMRVVTNFRSRFSFAPIMETAALVLVRTLHIYSKQFVSSFQSKDYIGIISICKSIEILHSVFIKHKLIPHCCQHANRQRIFRATMNAQICLIRDFRAPPSHIRIGRHSFLSIKCLFSMVIKICVHFPARDIRMQQ